MHWITTAFSAFSLTGWLVPMLQVKWANWIPRYLNEEPFDPDAPMPTLSIIVPALNEAETIEPALRSLIAVDYPNVEIIVVDDRSTDDTGKILDRMALEFPHIVPIHVTELPPGWLGKNHALHIGSEKATGEYILFTDADVHLDPSCLKRAIQLVQRRSLDHFVLFPEMILHGFWETATVWFFGVIFTIKFRPWKVSDPDDPAYMGVGAFNLVRAEAYRSFGGHTAFPLDITDDMRLGKEVKRARLRSDVYMSGGMVRVRWVVGLKGIVHGLTKNAFAGMDYSIPKTVFATLILFPFAVWPMFGILLPGNFSRAMSALTLAIMVYAASKGKPKPGASALYGLTFPLSGLVVMWIMIRSTFITLKNDGVNWRGTHYPLSELRGGLKK
ncbi:MAG: glycosyltransferase family 2 protein [Chthonomonadales bacterium]